MYTILVSDKNELITTVKERIVQRSKLVDNLHFLVNPTYKEYDMRKFTAMLEYITPVSRELKSEILTQSDELYKGMIEYKLPIDTVITKEAGNIEILLTFAYVEMDADGQIYQHVRKVTPTNIHIVPVPAWCNIVPDSALTALDQRLIKIDAQINGINEYISSMYDTQVDNLSYDKDECELQLTSHGVGIGNKVSIKNIMEDGIPVVDIGSMDVPEQDDVIEDDDNVVEF